MRLDCKSNVVIFHRNVISKTAEVLNGVLNLNGNFEQCAHAHTNDQYGRSHAHLPSTWSWLCLVPMGQSLLYVTIRGGGWRGGAQRYRISMHLYKYSSMSASRYIFAGPLALSVLDPVLLVVLAVYLEVFC